MTFARQSTARKRTQMKVFDDSMTEQSHKEECDIHNILRK